MISLSYLLAGCASEVNLNQVAATEPTPTATATPSPTTSPPSTPTPESGPVAITLAHHGLTFDIMSDWEYDLNSQIADKEDELERIQVRIIETGEAPIRMGAGEFGTFDIPPGRYRVTGSSNFFVRDRNGRSRVNIILGGGRNLDSYVFTLDSGDTIEASAPFVLTPVQ